MYFLAVLYLFLPAGFANMVPPFAALIFPEFDFPIDFKAKFRGRRLFGGHKTFRGFLFGTLAGFVCIYLQKYLFLNFSFFRHYSLVDYSLISPLFGAALGFGSLVGDALKSFFKRQAGIKPGNSWFPWDQIDWIIGSLIFATPFIHVDLTLIVSYLLIGLIAHLLSKIVGFILRINDTAF